MRNSFVFIKKNAVCLFGKLNETTMMKSKIISCLALFALLSATSALAQKDKYHKLDNYYVLEKYDDCVDEAESMQLNEKYSKDTEPYLYAAMGYMGVYHNPDKYTLKKYPDYKDPLRKSLSNFGKFRKRDKTGEKFQDNQNFANELKNETFIMMADLQEKNDKSKLGSYSREIAKAFPDDGAMMLLSAAYLIASGNAGDGIKNADAAFKMLDSVATAGSLKPSEQEMKALSSCFIIYTDYLIEQKDKPKENKEKAMKFIALATKILPEDAAIKEQGAKIGQ
jgi:hypothetical protein